MPKERREKVTKRDPLEVTLREDAAADLEAAAALKKRKKAGRSGLKQFGGGGADGDDDGDDDDALMDGPGYVPDKVSRKILDQARRQAIEEGNDEEGAGGRRVRFTAGTEGGASSSSGRGRSGSMFSTASSRDGDGDGDEYEEEEEEIIEFGDEDGACAARYEYRGVIRLTRGRPERMCFEMACSARHSLAAAAS